MTSNEIINDKMTCKLINIAKRLGCCYTLFLLSGCSSGPQQADAISPEPGALHFLTTHPLDLKDDDRDGVINARDLCPGTPSNAEIDNDGCAHHLTVSQTLSLRILFEHDAIAIHPIFQKQLDKMAAFLKTHPTTAIELKGYASPVGDARYNRQLAEKRTQAIGNYLKKAGISAKRIHTVSFGATDLEQAANKQLDAVINRRVSATVVGYHGEIERKWTIFSTISEKKTNYR